MQRRSSGGWCRRWVGQVWSKPNYCDLAILSERDLRDSRTIAITLSLALIPLKVRGPGLIDFPPLRLRCTSGLSPGFRHEDRDITGGVSRHSSDCHVWVPIDSVRVGSDINCPVHLVVQAIAVLIPIIEGTFG